MSGSIRFDKTGTLTTARAVVEDFVVEHPGDRELAHSCATALAASSSHALSRAISGLSDARDSQPVVHFEHVRVVPGRGVVGDLVGTATTVSLGSPLLMRERALELGPVLRSRLERDLARGLSVALVGWKSQTQGTLRLHGRVAPRCSRGDRLAERRRPGRGCLDGRPRGTRSRDRARAGRECPGRASSRAEAGGHPGAAARRGSGGDGGRRRQRRARPGGQRRRHRSGLRRRCLARFSVGLLAWQRPVANSLEHPPGSPRDPGDPPESLLGIRLQHGGGGRRGDGMAQPRRGGVSDGRLERDGHRQFAAAAAATAVLLARGSVRSWPDPAADLRGAATMAELDEGVLVPETITP